MADITGLVREKTKRVGLTGKDEFPLWMFFDSKRIVITRGRTQEEAFQHASKNWQKGETISFANYLPIQSAELYNINHSPGWLKRPMVWLLLEDK